MTEPLKPRIDFDGPLEVDQNPKFRAQQTFDKISGEIGRAHV